MIKHILALFASVIALILVWYVYSIDVSVKSLQRVEDIIEKSKVVVKIDNHQNTAQNREKEENKEINNKVRALEEKAGNIGAFKVSKLYKTKCASCHGINGNGGVGPKLSGLSYETLTKSLKDFKDGVKKNYVMFGLLQNLNAEQLDSLSKEIATFGSKEKKVK